MVLNENHEDSPKAPEHTVKQFSNSISQHRWKINNTSSIKCKTEGAKYIFLSYCFKTTLMYMYCKVSHLISTHWGLLPERVEKEGGSKLKILTPSLFYYRSFLCILVIFFCFFFKGEETQITSEAEREEIVWLYMSTTKWCVLIFKWKFIACISWTCYTVLINWITTQFE